MGQLSALEIMDRYGSLGPDFLTWVGVHVGREDLPAPASEPGLQASVLGPVVLASELGEATKVTLAGEEAASSPEFAAALRAGKRLMRARLEFTAQDAKWLFTLDAETFDLRSIKLPVPKLPDLDEYLMMRVQATQHLARLVDELFEQFLVLRLDAARWKEELAAWQNGAAG